MQSLLRTSAKYCRTSSRDAGTSAGAGVVAVAGMDKPALSAEEKQLCVEGLKHGERYSVTLRAGLPSTVRETLSLFSSFYPSPASCLDTKATIGPSKFAVVDIDTHH